MSLPILTQLRKLIPNQKIPIVSADLLACLQRRRLFLCIGCRYSLFWIDSSPPTTGWIIDVWPVSFFAHPWLASESFLSLSSYSVHVCCTFVHLSECKRLFFLMNTVRSNFWQKLIIKLIIHQTMSSHPSFDYDPVISTDLNHFPYPYTRKLPTVKSRITKIFQHVRRWIKSHRRSDKHRSCNTSFSQTHHLRNPNFDQVCQLLYSEQNRVSKLWRYWNFNKSNFK